MSATHSNIDYDDVDRRRSELAISSEKLQARITAAGGRDVSVLAVSKGHPVEAAVAALQLGITTLGENYAQELAAKDQVIAEILDLEDSPGWHFVGQLQTNKVKTISHAVTTWQSVDRLKVGREIAKHAPGSSVFAQVNLSDEPQKGGCAFEQLDELVESLRELDLSVDGLMGVGTANNDDQTGRGFAQLRAATDRLHLTHCSMGMTADLEIAIREGSTMVRVGSDLFGPRPQRD